MYNLNEVLSTLFSILHLLGLIVVEGRISSVSQILFNKILSFNLEFQIGFSGCRSLRLMEEMREQC